MKQARLCLHAGGHEVDLAALAAVQTPAPTETWFPLAHDSLVARVRTGLANANLEIVTESHALAKDGMRYFGLFQISRPGVNPDDYGLVMGLRNSHDKTFPAGIVAGSNVFVCDNLAFSSEVRLARKHTLNIFRDLPGKVSEAIGRLSDMWVSQALRFDTYKATPLENRKDLHDLLVRAVVNKAITKTQLMDVLAEWDTPSHAEFASRSVWSLFNAFTEIGKANSLDVVPARTMALHGLLDGFCGIDITKGKPPVIEI